MSFDRNDPYYKACMTFFVAGGAVAGLEVGGAGAVFTLGNSLWAGPLAGAAMGFAAGYLACPAVSQRLRKKFDGEAAALDDFALYEAVGAMQKYANVHNSHDALKLVAMVHARPRHLNRGPQTCANPNVVSGNLLAYLRAVDSETSSSSSSA